MGKWNWQPQQHRFAVIFEPGYPGRLPNELAATFFLQQAADYAAYKLADELLDERARLLLGDAKARCLATAEPAQVAAG